MYIISAADFSLFYSNSVRKCLILTAECSPKKSLILLEILRAEFIQAFCLDWGFKCYFNHLLFSFTLGASKKISEEFQGES